MSSSSHIPRDTAPETDNSALNYGHKSHAAKKHTFRGGDKDQPVEVTVHVADVHGVTPRAESWKADFERAPGAPQRQIINLILRAGKFEPPVQLRAKMLPNELGDSNSRLAYYDPRDKSWHPFADADFFKEADEFVVWIHEWFDDPGVGSWP